LKEIFKVLVEWRVLSSTEDIMVEIQAVRLRELLKCENTSHTW